MSGKTNKDSFHFLSNSFTLIASRSKMFVDGTILSNSTNSINSQLLKGLLYYYSLAKDFPNIKQISIIRKRAKSIDFNYKECKTDIIQPIIGSGNKNSLYKRTNLKLFSKKQKR